MLRLISWKAIALIASGLLQVRFLLLVLVVAYFVGWIIGLAYGRGF
jgi:hypothetical protein